ncbi:DUF262 domain-containing protein [Parasedimentitalea huanghaiensis]|nr:DUF262 domain-containing protein [Zongyanglinia huanghaiensis]
MSEDEFEVETHNEDAESFIEYDLQIYPSDYTLRGINDMWKDGEIEIPEFQRNFVWTIKQSSLLIESFLLGLPVPQLFFYIDDEHKNLVIDGQQRITTVIDFLEGYFGPENNKGRRQVFRLAGLDDKSPYNKKRFTDLEEKDQRKLKNTVLRVVNIRQVAPANDTTSMYHIFERLNTGGTPLKPQEIRNCVFSGPIVKELRALNLDENWRTILGRPAPEKHQRDIEMLLRVFAFTFHAREYEKPMKEFLNIAMKKSKAGTTQDWEKFKQVFPVVCEELVKQTGDRPFNVRGPINLAAMDSILPTLINSRPHNGKNLKDKLSKLFSDEEYRENIFFNTSDNAAVEKRIKIAKTYLA